MGQVAWPAGGSAFINSRGSSIEGDGPVCSGPVWTCLSLLSQAHLGTCRVGRGCRVNWGELIHRLWCRQATRLERQRLQARKQGGLHAFPLLADCQALAVTARMFSSPALECLSSQALCPPSCPGSRAACGWGCAWLLPSVLQASVQRPSV